MLSDLPNSKSFQGHLEREDVIAMPNANLLIRKLVKAKRAISVDLGRQGPRPQVPEGQIAEVKLQDRKRWGRMCCVRGPMASGK